MENPFKKFFKKPQEMGDIDKAIDEYGTAQQEQIHQTEMEDLTKNSPEAAKLFEELKNPSISGEEFMRRIGEFNNSAQEIPAEGRYKQIDIAIGEDRRLKAKIFENGRVTLGGSDNSQF